MTKPATSKISLGEGPRAQRISGYLPLRIGSVSFLNAAPLHYGLGANLKLLPPRELAAQLRSGMLDMALVPVMEVLEHPHYVMTNGYGICSEGEVYSVILFPQKSLDKVRSVAVDSTSKTSVMLLKVLFERYLEQKITLLPENSPADAQLWIGDRARALRQVHPDGPYWDLGRAWTQFTNLPFVYAVWAMPRRRDNLPSANYIRQICATGLEMRHLLASTPGEYRYLTHHIRYELGEKQKAGLRLFATHLVEMGLIDYVPNLDWV
jgi:predicted solute-binding protein